MSVYESDLSRLVDELNRSMPGTKSDRTSLDTLLGLAAEQGASDVILVGGSAITLRVNGSLGPATGKVVSPEELRASPELKGKFLGV